MTVALLELGDRTAQLRSVAPGAARHFTKYTPRASGAQPTDLRLDALAIGRDARIAVDHALL
jgi:hypothetical protein